MRRLALVFLAAAAALFLPRTLGFLRGPRAPVLELRDSLSGTPWPDLAAIHERAADGRPNCAWCHVAPGTEAAAPAGEVSSGICLSCHDGRVAPAAAHTLPGQRPRDVDPGGANHPVGVDYMSSLMSRPEYYNHPASNPSIRLEHGLVGCVSCHRGHSRNGRSEGPAALIEGACVTCHNL